MGQHDNRRKAHRSGIVRFAVQVIRANELTDAELELQLDSIWQTGYIAGRKARIRADLVQKGVASIRRMRRQAAESNSPLQSLDVGKIHVKP